jgi:hypothetical protein
MSTSQYSERLFECECPPHYCNCGFEDNDSDYSEFECECDKSPCVCDIEAAKDKEKKDHVKELRRQANEAAALALAAAERAIILGRRARQAEAELERQGISLK